MTYFTPWLLPGQHFLKFWVVNRQKARSLQHGKGEESIVRNSPGFVGEISRCVRGASTAILMWSIFYLVSLTSHVLTKSWPSAQQKLTKYFSWDRSLIWRFLVRLILVFLNDVGSADESRSPKVEHLSVLMKALKWHPSRLFPGMYFVINF